MKFVRMEHKQSFPHPTGRIQRTKLFAPLRDGPISCLEIVPIGSPSRDDQKVAFAQLRESRHIAGKFKG
jgi:hypothetical protein